jgi:hypothetical protein
MGLDALPRPMVVVGSGTRDAMLWPRLLGIGCELRAFGPRCSLNPFLLGACNLKEVLVMLNLTGS